MKKLSLATSLLTLLILPQVTLSMNFKEKTTLTASLFHQFLQHRNDEPIYITDISHPTLPCKTMMKEFDHRGPIISIITTTLKSVGPSTQTSQIKVRFAQGSFMTADNQNLENGHPYLTNIHFKHPETPLEKKKKKASLDIYHPAQVQGYRETSPLFREKKRK